MVLAKSISPLAYLQPRNTLLKTRRQVTVITNGRLIFQHRNRIFHGSIFKSEALLPDDGGGSIFPGECLCKELFNNIVISESVSTQIFFQKLHHDDINRFRFKTQACRLRKQPKPSVDQNPIQLRECQVWKVIQCWS